MDNLISEKLKNKLGLCGAFCDGRVSEEMLLSVQEFLTESYLGSM